MLTCREVAKTLSSGEELGLVKHIKLKVHLFMCKHCSQYAEHLKITRNKLKDLFAVKTEQNENRIAQLEREVLENLRKKA